MQREAVKPKYRPYLEAYGLGALNPEGLSLLQFARGEDICRAGHPMEYLLFIVRGRAKVCYDTADGRSLMLCFYTDEGILGDMELMLQSSVALTGVRAVTAVDCIGVSFARYGASLRQNLTFMNYAATSLAKKLDHSGRNGAINALLPLPQRLCAYLLEIQNHGYVSVRRTELAEVLGCSYRHLLRTLDTLCVQGLLCREGKGYRIVSIEAMKDGSGGT